MCEENIDNETSQSAENEMKANEGNSRKRPAFQLLADQQERSTSAGSAGGSAGEVLDSTSHYQSASTRVPSTSYLPLNSSHFRTEQSYHASARDGQYNQYNYETATIRQTRGGSSIPSSSEEQEERIAGPTSSFSSSASMPQHEIIFNGSATVPASSSSFSTATRQQSVPSNNLLVGGELSGNHNNQFAAGINLPYEIHSNLKGPSSFSSDLLTTGIHNSVPVAQIQSSNADNKQKQGKKEETKIKEDDTTSKKRKKPGRKKKREGAPKRPMSAYNFFFQEERKRLLDALPKKDDESGPQTKNRRDRRSPHNKISFSTLGKTIGKNWKQLGSVEMARHEELARRDSDRYLLEMKAFEAKEKLVATGGLQTPMKSCEESISSISKNEWFATNQFREHYRRPTTSIEHHDFQRNSMQHANAYESNIPPLNMTQEYSFNMAQYPHFFVSYGSSVLGNTSFTHNAANDQALPQTPYTIQSMSQQQILSQSVSSVQECQNPASFSSATPKDKDILEPIPLVMTTLKSQADTQEDSPTLYYFEEESGSPNF